MSYNPFIKYSSLWWRFWLHLPGDVFCFLVRIWDYAPLLWEDRDWDYAYLLRMMRFKIQRMRKSMERNTVIANAEDYVAETAAIDVLLRNVIDEDPDDEWSMHYDMCDDHTTGFGACKNRLEHGTAFSLSAAREKRNWKALWRHFDKYLLGWWI